MGVPQRLSGLRKTIAAIAGQTAGENIFRSDGKHMKR
jgi:hypothetical protein